MNHGYTGYSLSTQPLTLATSTPGAQLHTINLVIACNTSTGAKWAVLQQVVDEVLHGSTTLKVAARYGEGAAKVVVSISQDPALLQLTPEGCGSYQQVHSRLICSEMCSCSWASATSAYASLCPSSALMTWIAIQTSWLDGWLCKLGTRPTVHQG
jgi:hypothetical protein